MMGISTNPTSVMLLDNQQPSHRSKEIEAFNATVAMFKIRLVDLAATSGAKKRDIEKFKIGSESVTSKTLTRIILGFTPAQRSFYSGMISLQYSAEEGNVRVPILKLRKLDNATDIYRDALNMTLEAFGIKRSQISKGSGIAQSNLTNWTSGAKDFQLSSIEKIKKALEREQRNFYNALIEVLFILTAA